MERTFEQVFNIYNEYLDGNSLKELDRKYSTDTYYLFKKTICHVELLDNLYNLED